MTDDTPWLNCMDGLQMNENEEKVEFQEPFYKFFVCDFFATGEGRSIWLMVDRWYGKGYSDPLMQFKQFIEDPYYYSSIEEVTEREFLDKYTRMMPNLVAHMIQQKNQANFSWQTHLSYNVS